MEEKTDEELIRLLRGGHSEVTDYLMEKYKNLVRSKANALLLIGGEQDDLIQEGMIGLFKAIRDYDESKDASFRHFAEICINRQLYTAIEASNRKKNAPLNTYVSIDASDGTKPLEEIFRSFRELSPEELVIRAEDFENIRRTVEEKLSKLEKKVLFLYLSGMSYQKIGETLGKSTKSIDNALHRVRQKLGDGYYAGGIYKDLT